MSSIGRRRLIVALASLIGVSSIALPATAQPTDDASAAAADTYASALSKFDALDYAGALALFESALEATASPNAALYVARCLRELGRAPEAYEAMRRAVQLSSARAKEEGRFEETRNAAVAELTELEHHVGRVFVALTDPPADAAVTIGARSIPLTELELLEPDGSRRAAAPSGAVILPVAVEPGAVRISVVAAGRTPFDQSIEVRPGPPKRVVVPALAVVSAVAPPPVTAPVVVPDASSDRGDTQRILGLVVGGVGVVGLGIGGIFGAMALSKSADGDAACDGELCSQEGLDLHDEADDLANVSNVGFAAGAVLVAAGAILFIAAPSGPADARVFPVVFTGGAGDTPRVGIGFERAF